jgi:hypothetical protein
VTVHGLQPFFYRHQVQWNKGGINIRVNKFGGNNFSFSDIKQLHYAPDAYTVETDSGKKNIKLEGY